jgi:hydrogenase maturation protease
MAQFSPMPAPAKQLQAILRLAKDRGLPVVLLGIGNPLRGDDAIGNDLAHSLAELNAAHFQAYEVGTSIENASHWVRRAAGGVLLLVDAVFDESLPEGTWAFFPDDRLDTVCHTTHSLPLSILISLWRQELPNIEIFFLGISIRNNTEFAGLSPALQNTLQELTRLITTVYS